MQRRFILALAFVGTVVLFGLTKPDNASAGPYPNGCEVVFQADNGQYLSADGGGGGGLYATGGWGNWERFVLEDASSGRYFIRASTGHYWMANDGGGSWVNAASTNRLSWEQFEFYDRGGGYVAIQSINDYFVVAEGGGGGEVNANRTGIGNWETFYMHKVSGCDPIDDAQFVSQSVPTTMATGADYQISVTMRNSGGTTWVANSDYKLGDRCDCNTWVTGARVQTASNVGPGSDYTFTFNVHAPATAGTYTMRWMMVREGVHWYGPFSNDVTINVIDPTPSLTGLTISPGAVKPDNATPYSITVSGTNPTGGGNISHEYALINLQGGNAGSYRGYLTWYWASAWTGNIACSGGGYAVVQGTANGNPGYGEEYITLDSCSTSVSGNTRTTVFNVRFKPAFSSPVTNNDISGYIHDGPTGRNTGWVNVDINFRLAFPPAFDSVSPVNTIFLTNTNSLSLTVNNFRNANAIRFYIWTANAAGQDDIICPTFSVTETSTAATQTFTVPLTGQPNCWTGAANQTLTDVGRVSVHVYAYNSVSDHYAIGYNGFTRSYPGNVNINIDAGVGWTLTAPAGWTPSTYTGTGPQNLTNLPYGSYTLTPAARAGYTSQVAPSTIQVLQ